VAQRTQLIFSESPGSLPATYELPANLDLELSSVVARYNGATAAAAFIPVLEVLSQDERLVARIRIDQEYAIGDTGVNTWAPFLRRRLPASLAEVSAKVERTSDQSIPNLTVTPVVFDTTLFTHGGMALNAGNDGLVVPAGGAGRYHVHGGVLWDVDPNGFRAVILTVNDDFRADHQIPSVIGAFNTEIVVGLIDDLAVGDVVKMQVNQQSGVAINILGSAAGVRVWLGAARLPSAP